MLNIDDVSSFSFNCIDYGVLVEKLSLENQIFISLHPSELWAILHRVYQGVIDQFIPVNFIHFLHLLELSQSFLDFLEFPSILILNIR